MAIRLVTIDDEAYIRDFLIQEVEAHFAGVIEIVGQAGSIKEGVALIKKISPDIVLLDIELEDGNSFELLDQLNDIDFQLIFITGFDDRAIDAIKLGALDYLLKPIDEDELHAALSKAIENIEQSTNAVSPKMTDVASQFYKHQEKRHIILKTSDTIHLVQLDKLIYCKSEGNYTTFYIEGQSSVLISKPLKYAVELLPATHFVRCQQSYIINTAYVTSFLKSGSIILKDEIEVPVSGRNKDAILKEVMSKMK